MPNAEAKATITPAPEAPAAVHVCPKLTFGSVLDLLSDKLQTSVLDIQEYDGQKIDEVVEHILELGINARLNSIKATRARKIAEKKAEQLDKFNAFVAGGMPIEQALQYAGLALKAPSTK